MATELPPNRFFRDNVTKWAVPIYGLLPMLVVGLVTVPLHRAKESGRLGFRHRATLYKVMELVVLSQFLLVTAGFDQLADVVCNPDFLHQQFGGGWSGNNRCGDMLYQEKQVTDCEKWAEATQGILGFIVVWAALISVGFVWVYAMEDKNISRFMENILMAIFFMNGTMWIFYFEWAFLHEGVCHTMRAVGACSISFAFLSYTICVMEWYIPNSHDVHTVDSAADIAKRDNEMESGDNMPQAQYAIADTRKQPTTESSQKAADVIRPLGFIGEDMEIADP